MVNIKLLFLFIYFLGLNYLGYKMLQIGIERNPKIKKFPFPINDISIINSTPSTGGLSIHTILHRIQNKIYKNHSGIEPSLGKTGRSFSVVSYKPVQQKPKKIIKPYNIDTIRASTLFKDVPEND